MIFISQLNVVTGEREPMVPFWRMRLPATLMSFSVVALLVLMALATVLGVVLYRMSLLGANILRNGNVVTTYNPIMFTTATAACINLCFICLFNYVSNHILINHTVSLFMVPVQCHSIGLTPSWAPF